MNKINTIVKAIKHFSGACIGGGIMAALLDEPGGAIVTALAVAVTALAVRLEHQTNTNK